MELRPEGIGGEACLQGREGLLDALPISASRRVIDVSGDGEDNEGGDPARSRDSAVELGITINGLPILLGSRGLEDYYREHVIGGPGCFVMPARNSLSFRDAMTRKVLREVMGERMI